MTASALRALLASGRVTHVPGVYDPITAALAVRAGHRAVHLSGAAVSATMLGRPGLGSAHGAQIADRASTLVPALDGIPLLADADTGFDDPQQAVWTALAYSRAGIAGLHLADRAGPKQPGQPAGKEVAGAAEASARIAALAGQAPEIVLIARTGVYAARGLDETIVRCRAYAEAGADAVYPEGVDTLAELALLHTALPDVPLVISRSEALPRKGALSDADLAAAGVRLVLHPESALLAAVRAASLTYRAIADTGTAETVDRMPWAAFTAITGQGAEAADRKPWTAITGQDEAAGTDLDGDARYVPRNLQT